MAQSRFARDSIITLSVRILGIAFSFVSSIVVSRLLGPHGRGVYVLVITVSMLLVRFSGLGMGEAATFHIGKRTHATRDIVATMLAWALIGSIVAGGILLGLTGLSGHRLLADVDLGWLIVTALMTFPALTTASVQPVLLVLDRVGDYNVTNLLQYLLLMLFLFVFVLAGGMGPGGAILAWVIGGLATGAYALFRTLRVAGRLGRPRVSIMRTLLGYGSQPYLVSVLLFLCHRADVFFVGAYVDVAGVGLYTLAVTVAELVWHIPFTTSILLFPRLSKLEEGEANSVTPVVCRITVAMMLLGLLALLILGAFFVGAIYGSEYLPSASPLRLLLPGILSYGIGKILFNDMMARNKARYGIYSAGVNLAVLVILDVALIPTLGIEGAAIASSTAYTAGMLVLLVSYLRLTRQSARDILVLRLSDVKSLALVGRQALAAPLAFLRATTSQDAPN